MPRRPNPDLWVHWKLTLPATLAGKIAFLFHDPSTNKIKYGARNALVAELLERWLAERDNKAPLTAEQIADQIILRCAAVAESWVGPDGKHIAAAIRNIGGSIAPS